MSNQVNCENEEQSDREWRLVLPQSHSNKNNMVLVKKQTDQGNMILGSERKLCSCLTPHVLMDTSWIKT